nr:CDP-alcohol phosphatidyltransferase family protein [Antrihabitans stalactiti]
MSFFGRAAVSKATAPLGKALNSTGLTPDAVTVIGTVCSIAAAVTLFPSGHLFWGAMAIWMFVMFDMLDGAMARARGGGTKYGAVLDATCDRVADGAIFAGLAWWVVYHEHSKQLLVATLICLVTSQVISYAKARAEASGLSADGGLIERPDRLIIVLVGAGFTGIGGYLKIGWLEWSIHVAMWLLAVASVITVFQRLLEVRSSPGARVIIPIVVPAAADETPEP